VINFFDRNEKNFEKTKEYMKNLIQIERIDITIKFMSKKEKKSKTYFVYNLKSSKPFS